MCVCVCVCACARVYTCVCVCTLKCDAHIGVIVHNCTVLLDYLSVYFIIDRLKKT